MRTLLAHASDHQGTHITMGMYLARVGRYQEADEYLAKVPPGDDRIVVALYRTFVAMQSGDHERAAETLSFVTESLDRRGREGLRYGRARLAQRALTGDREGALATFTEHVGSGLRDGAGPAIGLYWIDFDPLLHGLVDDPRFQTLLAETRASLDSMRALLPEDPYRHH